MQLERTVNHGHQYLRTLTPPIDSMQSGSDVNAQTDCELHQTVHYSKIPLQKCVGAFPSTEDDASIFVMLGHRPLVTF